MKLKVANLKTKKENCKVAMTTKKWKSVIGVFTVMALIATSVMGQPIIVRATSAATENYRPYLALEMSNITEEADVNDGYDCILQRVIRLLQELADPEKEELLDYLLELESSQLTDEEKEALYSIYAYLRDIKDMEEVPLEPGDNPGDDEDEEDPTIDESTSNYPIIIVPGVMTSNLYASEVFTIDNRVYPPRFDEDNPSLDYVAGLGDRLRRSNPLFPRPMENMNVPGAHREYGANHLYQLLVDYLIEVFPEREIYFFAFDFRQDNRCIAISLNEGIEQILSDSEYDKVDIIAHSMGGLIIASYITQFSEGSLGRVITKGGSFEGSPQALVAVLERHLTGIRAVDLALLLVGGVGVDVKSEFSSAAQLAPTRSYFQENSFYIFSHSTGIIRRIRHYLQMNYNEYFGLLDSLFTWDERRLFREAEEFHQSILSNGINVLANYEHAYFAVGINQQTISGLRIDEESRIRGRIRVTDLIYENYGDGMVPYASQMMMGQLEGIYRADERVRKFDLCHLGFVGGFHGEYGHNDAIAWTVDILSGNSGSTEIQNAQFQSRNYTVIRIEGFVEVTVEGPDGILTSSEEEFSQFAPFGRMDVIGDEGEIVMLALENWEDYEVTLNVVGDGTLDYTIRWFDDDNHLVDERIFEDIPVNENETITSSTALESLTVLEIDSNGDGTVDGHWEAGPNEDGMSMGESRDLDGPINPAGDNPFFWSQDRIQMDLIQDLWTWFGRISFTGGN